MQVITIEDVKIEVERKKVKNFNLTVKAPNGKVKLTYPYHASEQDYQKFLYSKINWIKQKQNKYKNFKVPKQLEYKTGEKVWFLNHKYDLKIKFSTKRSVKLSDNNISLYILKTDLKVDKQKLLNEFYRGELYKILYPLVKKWELPMKVVVNETRIRNMKTLWGSCNIKARRIWVNLELIKYDKKCIEYVVVHEMVHLLERLHSKRFYKLMDKYLPDWREREIILNKRKKLI